MLVESAWPDCKQSYFAKPDVKAKFIEFVDASHAPNGCCNEGECFTINTCD